MYRTILQLLILAVLVLAAAVAGAGSAAPVTALAAPDQEETLPPLVTEAIPETGEEVVEEAEAANADENGPLLLLIVALVLGGLFYLVYRFTRAPRME